MSTLPFKIMQSDGGTLKCLATLADGLTANILMSAIMEDLFDQKGLAVTLWLEEYVDGRWVIGEKIDIADHRRLYHYLMEHGVQPTTLKWRRITQGEKDVIIDALNLLVRQTSSDYHLHTRRAYQKIAADNSYGHSEIKDKLEALIFRPWERLHHIENLAAYLKRNPIIVESEVILPEQL